MKPEHALTLGARIDAILQPFNEDESRLTGRLAELERMMRELHDETEQAKGDLAVIESAKIDALRNAAKEDPLLRVAFLGLNPPENPAPAPGSDSAPGDGDAVPADASHDPDHPDAARHDHEPRAQKQGNVDKRGQDVPRHRLLAVNE